MRRILTIGVALLGLSVASQTAVDAADGDAKGQIVLLHGLARSSGSMDKMAETLRSAGYTVCNIDYPSREHTIEKLAADFVAPAVSKCFADPDLPIHFVTHSLGGIVVRQLAATGAVPNMGRVVMLSPPNHGSEVVDKLGDWKLFAMLNGPAGSELSTRAESGPGRFGAASFELGIITGARTINPLLSMMIPGNDDGKVSIENAKLSGMRDFLVVSCSHPFIMKSDRAIEQTLLFLKHGAFARMSSSPEPLDCWD